MLFAGITYHSRQNLITCWSEILLPGSYCSREWIFIVMTPESSRRYSISLFKGRCPSDLILRFSWTALLWGSCQICKIAGCACAGNAGNVSPPPRVSGPRHASGHVRDARAVVHAGSLTSGFLWSRCGGENVSNIPGACATRNFTFLVRGPLQIIWPVLWMSIMMIVQ